MGGKSQPSTPPPPATDTSVQDKAAKEEAALKAERDKMLRTARTGRYGTILTSGKGLEEESDSARSTMGSGTKYT